MKLVFKAVGVAGLIGASVLVFVACSSDPKKTNPTTEPPAAGACTSTTGTYPEPACVTAACPATAANGGCTIDEAKCGKKSTCLPTADNAGKTVQDFRIRRLNVLGPEALAQAFVQATIVTKNIDLNAPECGESGNGAFNWLLRVDTAASTLTMGGAPPSADPFAKGFCFYNHINAGIDIKPATVALTKKGDAWSAAPAPVLNMPIFLNGDPTNVIVLPLSEAKVDSFTVSADSNCIGSFNENALDKTCGEDPATCARWNTQGNLGGYITLETADTVNVADLNESMCVLLTKSTKGADGKCQRENGKIKFQGDFCSTTKTPGGCADAYWLTSTFAASAVKINDGADTVVCNAGTTETDAGTDSGSDAGADTGAQDAAAE